MTKQEFIGKLRDALNGRIPTAQVTDTINYYEEYINTEIRKGKTEAEVMELLGEPRLIAKTIIQTSDSNEAQSAEYSDDYRQGSNYGYQNMNGYGSSGMNTGSRKTIKLPMWIIAIIAIIIVIVLVCVVFSVLSFLLPLIIVMAAVLLMVKLFRDWLN